MLLLVPLAGCWTYTAATPPRTGKVPDNALVAWPQRDPSVITDLVTAQQAQSNQSVEAFNLGIAAVRFGRGGEYSGFGESLEEFMYGFVPNADATTSRPLTQRRHEYRVAYDTFLPDKGERQRIAALPPDQRRAAVRRVWLGNGVELAIPVANGSERGVVIHLGALAGNEYEPQVVDELRARGWYVISVHPETKISPDISERDLSRLIEIRRRLNELSDLEPRFTSEPGDTMEMITKRMDDYQRLRKNSPLAPMADALSDEERSILNPPIDLGWFASQADAATWLANEIDEQIAETAYAAEAAYRVACLREPRLTPLPVVVVGFSAGTLAAPATALCIGSHVRAVVLIGAGSNLLQISQESRVSSGGIRLERNCLPAAQTDVRPLYPLYERASRLDPLVLAPHLRHVPVLMALATEDTWVPIEGGRRLWEALGRPDCWKIPLDHGGMFYRLPKLKRDIADWLEGSLP